jgi:hypothetical protein
VRERQVEEHRVLWAGEARQVVDDRHHRVVVAVRDHAALGRAGRSGGVDVGEEIVLLDRVPGFAQRGRMLGRVGTSPCREVVEVRERQDMPQAWNPVAHLLDLRPLRLVLAEHAHGFGVVEDVAGVLGRAVGVDRGGDRTDRTEREVEECPLDPARAEDRERVTLLDAKREQSIRVALHSRRGVGPGNLAPLVPVLGQVGRGPPVGRDGVSPEPLDCALVLHPSDSMEKGSRPEGRIGSVPLH